MTITKLGSVEATSDATLPQRFNTSLVALLKWIDMAKKVTIQEAIRKNETLAVTVER